MLDLIVSVPDIAYLFTLGRTPYFINIICRILKYLKRIDAMDDKAFQLKHYAQIKNYVKMVNNVGIRD